MKYFVFIGLLLVFLPMWSQKTVLEKDLPQVVVEGFALAYPDQPAHTWVQNNTRFVATVKYDDRVEFATFLENGEWAETRNDVERSDLSEKITTFLDTRYDAYRIQTLQYVEENGGGNYYAIVMSLKSNKNLTTELVFDLAGDLQMVDGLAVAENSDNQIVVKDDAQKTLKPGIQKEIIVENEGVPDIVLINLTKRYGAIDKIKWTKTDLGFHRADYKFRDENMATEWDDNGNQASVITFFTKKNAIYLIQKFIDENYPKAKFLKGERVVYESKFTRMFPDKGLKSFFVVELSDKLKGAKKPISYAIYFDQTGQLDMIVEKEDSNENE